MAEKFPISAGHDKIKLLTSHELTAERCGPRISEGQLMINPSHASSSRDPVSRFDGLSSKPSSAPGFSNLPLQFPNPQWRVSSLVHRVWHAMWLCNSINIMQQGHRGEKRCMAVPISPVQRNDVFGRHVSKARTSAAGCGSWLWFSWPTAVAI